MINRTTKIRCWFFFQISYQWVFPVQFVLWEQVTGNAMLLPSDRTTIGESLYVQRIKHISNTNSLICHSVIHRWILINRNKQFIKFFYKIVLLFEDMGYFYSRIKKNEYLEYRPRIPRQEPNYSTFCFILKGFYQSYLYL